MAENLEIEKALVKRLNLLPDYSSGYFMRVWSALVESESRVSSLSSDIRKLAEALKKFVDAHEKWEAGILLDHELWDNGACPFPDYDGATNVQYERNNAKSALSLPSVKQALESKPGAR